MLTSNLACGPMSREIVEAIFRHSHKFGKQLMLICSRNQVDENGGYVFTTKEYMEYVALMRQQYQKSDVIICRDHCGPGFGISNNTLNSVEDTIRCDLESGFDLIHIDLCHLNAEHDEKLRHTLRLMEFARSIRSDVMFEIGTDENVGTTETDVERIVSDVKRCQEVANPVFYVVQTGSLVTQNRNTGKFNIDAVEAMHEALRNCSTKLKEHNADYLTTDQIAMRRGIVDAVNIAPQLGVIQTSLVLSHALTYGIDTSPFVDKVARDVNWKKWNCHLGDHHLCALVSGHYHFSGPAYLQLADQLNQKINIRECIIEEIINVIEHYLFAME